MFDRSNSKCLSVASVVTSNTNFAGTRDSLEDNKDFILLGNQEVELYGSNELGFHTVYGCNGGKSAWILNSFDIF